MLKRDLGQLSVYSLKEETEVLPLECFRNFYLFKTSEIVYIVKDKKLYGIVSMGEVLRGHCLNSMVHINTNFTVLKSFNIVKAQEIFQRKQKIHKIPIVNKSGELLGEYSRWDDVFYIERNQERLMQKETVREILGPYETVCVIEPVSSEDVNYLKLLNYLDSFEVSYMVLSKELIYEKLLEKNICIFLNEDERRGIQCLYGVEPRTHDSQGYSVFQYDLLRDKRWKARLATYKSLLLQIEEINLLRNLGIEKPDNLSYGRVDEKGSILLSAIARAGIKCFGLSSCENEATEYGRQFMKEVYEHRMAYPPNFREPWPKREENEEFYGELYQFEDYRNNIVQKTLYDIMPTYHYRKDKTGKYCNTKDGRRITCLQPNEFIGTIYFLGPCWVLGVFVEDQYTVASCLQRKLLERGYQYKVENYGEMLRSDASMDDMLRKIGSFQSTDIVIYESGEGTVVGIQGDTLENIFQQHQIPSAWVTDAYGHCNHKANLLAADGILEMIKPYLDNKKEENTNQIKIAIDVRQIMRDYIRSRYLNLYFRDFFSKAYNTVGAIVADCSFFNKGHRYLIEQAKAQVEFLIIFIIEKDQTIFPFEERFRLVKEGTKDLDNIMVVPGGEFILSDKTFPQYFTKAENEAVVPNAEYDLDVFINYVAGPLHITHRFAGKEPNNSIKKIYYEKMRTILSQYGIYFVEVEKMEVDGEIVSLSKVQNYLKREEYEKAFTLLPDSTKQYLIKQLNLKVN